MTAPLSLTWHPITERPDLLAEPVRAALLTSPLREDIEVTEIDPDLADTAALVEATDITLEESANCIVVLGRRGEKEKVAAALVLAHTRADVNTTVRKSLDVRKASFMPMERAVEESGMEYGGITPVGLPAEWPVLVDAQVLEQPQVVIGSGLRRSKLRMPGALVATLPTVEVIEGLGR
ncbi:YbaK/EbsC family protein [Ornithinicoccus hortensis]|uniref:Prolyl-tRNA editing enzyme YbaK/EbsC (Cys-tRNA(Pro) deacylase) n=1 Tax=Ornithinicoccus hortensis TaxID=82346 RepID=A0A542YSU4_9MICO|nr:YbaK/EbsC family protein [Ornithinicoccus hortensis]TQL51148.1 prolyl-tRNA editing enzyme YbaK/EbsC (Cys-tRNA(Pro) deacylase) [Ornithinicoccus hortensis]